MKLKIEQHVIDASRAHYDPETGLGNKVLAIKHVRTETGASLKTAKDAVEDNFSDLTCEVDNHDTPGYHIDKVFELGRKLAYHYAELEKLGFTFGSK